MVSKHTLTFSIINTNIVAQRGCILCNLYRNNYWSFILKLYRVSSLTMRTKVKQFHHQKIDNPINQTTMKLSQVQMLTSSRMPQMDTEFHKEWPKRSTSKHYNNNNTNNNLQTWPRSSKKHTPCRCKCKCRLNKRCRWKEMEHKNSKMPTSMSKTSLKKQARCQEVIWKRKKSTVKKRSTENDHKLITYRFKFYDCIIVLIVP